MIKIEKIDRSTKNDTNNQYNNKSKILHLITRKHFHLPIISSYAEKSNKKLNTHMINS